MHYYTRFKNHEHSYEVTHPQHKHTFITMQSWPEFLKCFLRYASQSDHHVFSYVSWSRNCWKQLKRRWSSWAEPSFAVSLSYTELGIEVVHPIFAQLTLCVCFPLLWSGEGIPPNTRFIEDGVCELLKTRRVLKCSYPYGFFLQQGSTQKEIFELMQVI